MKESTMVDLETLRDRYRLENEWLGILTTQVLDAGAEVTAVEGALNAAIEREDVAAVALTTFAHHEALRFRSGIGLERLAQQRVVAQAARALLAAQEGRSNG
jgi:hypothetical protein